MIDYKNMLIKLRAKEDLSQEKAAKLFKVTFAAYNRWENDQAMPSRKHLQQIIDICMKYGIGV